MEKQSIKGLTIIKKAKTITIKFLASFVLVLLTFFCLVFKRIIFVFKFFFSERKNCKNTKKKKQKFAKNY